MNIYNWGVGTCNTHFYWYSQGFVKDWLRIEKHAQDSPSFVILWTNNKSLSLSLSVYIYIQIQVSNINECKKSIQRTHLFVGLSRNVYGFRVGHFSSQTNLIGLTSFLPNPTNSCKCCLRSVTIAFACVSLLQSPKALFMILSSLAKRRFLDKFGSYGTIHIFKDYFATVFSALRFQFSVFSK